MLIIPRIIASLLRVVVVDFSMPIVVLEKPHQLIQLDD